jgi:hypothetical protein
LPRSLLGSRMRMLRSRSSSRDHLVGAIAHHLALRPRRVRGRCPRHRAPASRRAFAMRTRPARVRTTQTFAHHMPSPSARHRRTRGRGSPYAAPRTGPCRAPMRRCMRQRRAHS